MKKLCILVMAMVLVVSMSLGVMGDSNELNEDQEVPVNIGVEDMAWFGVGTGTDGNSSFDLNIADPHNASESGTTADILPVTIKANCDVTVGVENSIDATALGISESLLDTTAEDEGSDGWVLSTNCLAFGNEHANFMTFYNPELDPDATFDLPAGAHTFDVTYEINVNEENDAWTQLTDPGENDNVGNVVFTITPQTD